jgi:chromosome segregation ATPase
MQKKGKDMTLLNGKNFDITFIINRFNNNQELLLETIAEEYGLSMEELLDRCTRGASPEEKPRVKQMKSQNTRRKKRLEKQRTAAEKQKAKEEKESNVKESQLETQCEELKAQIAEAKKKLDEADANLVSKLAVSDASKEKVSKIKETISSLEKDVKSMESKLKKINQEIEELREELEGAIEKQKKDKAALRGANGAVVKAKENFEWLKLQLEDLESRFISLIPPGYDLSKGLPEKGRAISNIEMEGVEVEAVESNIDSLTFGQMMAISRKTGFDNVLELGTAYEFAWLVKKYMEDPLYEASVITDDGRINAIVNLVMAL